MLDGMSGTPRAAIQDLVWDASRVTGKFQSYIRIVTGVKNDDPLKMTWVPDGQAFVCVSDKGRFEKQDIDKEMGVFRLVGDSRTVVALGRAFAVKMGTGTTLFVYYGDC